MQWNEGKGFTLRLHNDKGDGVPPLFSRATFKYAISAESATQTRLTNTMTFEMKWGWLGSMLAKLIMRPIQHLHSQIVIGQKLFYETGEKANSAQVKAILRQS